MSRDLDPQSTSHSQYSSRYVGNFTLSLLPNTVKPLGTNNLLCLIKVGIHVYQDNYNGYYNEMPVILLIFKQQTVVALRNIRNRRMSLLKQKNENCYAMFLTVNVKETS